MLCIYRHWRGVGFRFTILFTKKKIKSLILILIFPSFFCCFLSMIVHRYHYRETVVVSALQVLKYPLTMPGPAAVAAKNNNNYENSLSITTPPMRHLPTYYVAPSSQAAWSETLSDGRTSKLGAFSTNSNTPVHSPAPHRSPKIKLKYGTAVN